MKILLATTVIILLGTTIFAQGRSCAIGSVRFACPSKYFKEVSAGNAETRTFKYKEAGTGLYFFMSVPKTAFKPGTVGETVIKVDPKFSKEKFEWKPVIDPLVMDMETKYKYDLVASMGLSKSKLLEVKGFIFAVKGKSIVLGYVSDWSEDPAIDRITYKVGKGFADNAPGCNAVVTALNSVTKEFRQREQGCFLTGLAAPN
jgi:hypothetical protein